MYRSNVTLKRTLDPVCHDMQWRCKTCASLKQPRTSAMLFEAMQEESARNKFPLWNALRQVLLGKMFTPMDWASVFWCDIRTTTRNSLVWCGGVSMLPMAFSGRSIVASYGWAVLKPYELLNMDGICWNLICKNCITYQLRCNKCHIIWIERVWSPCT